MLRTEYSRIKIRLLQGAFLLLGVVIRQLMEYIINIREG